MPERRVVIGSLSGLHARPAAALSRAAATCGVAVKISKGDVTVDAASILGVLSLRAEHGDEVCVSTESPDADGVLDQLAELLATDLDAASS